MTDVWLHEGKEIRSIDDIPAKYKEHVGVIYCIVAENGTHREYIGQKKLFRKRKRVIGKRELSNCPDKRFLKKYKSKKGKNKGAWVYYEELVEDNGFIEYCGSNDILKKDIKDGVKITKYILRFVKKESMLNYWEQKHLFCEGVLENPDHYYNNNIGGRFYKNNIHFEE
jgi:hypothetical protein